MIIRDRCIDISNNLERFLPGMEQGRVDPEDLPRLWIGRITTHLILDYEDRLTARQQQVVQLYYRESLLQREISERLSISQPAVNKILADVRRKVWKLYKNEREGIVRKAPHSTTVAPTPGANGAASRNGTLRRRR